MTAGGTETLNETDTKSVQHEETFEKSFDENLTSPEHQGSSLALKKSSNNYDVDGKSKADDSQCHDPNDAIESDDDDDTSDVTINQEPILKSYDVTEPVQKAHVELTLHWINMCTEAKDNLKRIGIQLMNANIWFTNPVDHTECGWLSDNESRHQNSVHVLENRIKHLRDTSDIDMFKCLADPVGVETPDSILYYTADSLEKDFAFVDTVIEKWDIMQIEMNRSDPATTLLSVSTLCKDYAQQFGDDCKFVSHNIINLPSFRNAEDDTHNKTLCIPEICEVKISSENLADTAEHQKATPLAIAYVQRDPYDGIDSMKDENQLVFVPKPPSTIKPKKSNIRRNRKIVKPHINPAVGPTTKQQTKTKDDNLNGISRCSWPLGHHNAHLYLGSDPRMGTNEVKCLSNKPSKLPVNTVFIIREQYKSAASEVLEKNWPIGLHNVRKFLGFDPRRRGYKADRIDGGKTRIPISNAYILRKRTNNQTSKKKLCNNHLLNRKELTPSPRYTKSHMSADNRNCFQQKERNPKLKGEYKRVTADTKELPKTVDRDTSSIGLPAIHRPRKAEASCLYQRNSDTKLNSMSENSLPKIRGVYTYTGESSLSHHSYDGPSQRRKGMLRTRW